MIETVEKFLKKYNLLTSDKTYLVGFSGGCDSLCLLDILNLLSKKYSLRLIALHLNHNWRAEESMRDEQNCKKFCEENTIEYISETLSEDIPRNENSARQSRYDFFIKYAKKYPNSIIFTAHNKTDNAETILYRITKGTGIKGLCGIPPERQLEGFMVYRPLLETFRDEIEDYCAAKGLVANVDSSNFDIAYKRNFLRHKVMPLLKEINFSAEKSLISLSKIAQNQNKIVDEYLSLIKKELYQEEKILSEKFKSLSFEVQQKIVYDLCLEQRLDYDLKKITNVLNFILENINSKSGLRYSLTNDLWLFVSTKYIYLITRTKGIENNTEIKINSEGEWGFPLNKIFSIKKYSGEKPLKFPEEKAFNAYINLDEKEFNLTLRTRREGDWIKPFGMTGKMKLKKFLNSKKISQHEKDELVMLCKGSEVLWIAGVGLSNKLKVVNIPSHVIELKSK